MPHDEITLLDVARAAKAARDFTAGMNREAFLKDAKTQSAVLHQLLILGEAVKRLSGEFRSAHNEIPWTLIAGMRDKLIHAYDEVDLEQVWKTVGSDILDLIVRITPLLPEEG
jgi:uncharacterized protein with HEPN domain